MVSWRRAETSKARTLSSEHSARLLVLPEIRLCAYEDEGRVFAEMRHLGVPLQGNECLVVEQSSERTLSWTFASEVGKSTLKTMRMTSLSG